MLHQRNESRFKKQLKEFTSVLKRGYNTSVEMQCFPIPLFRMAFCSGPLTQ